VLTNREGEEREQRRARRLGDQISLLGTAALWFAVVAGLVCYAYGRWLAPDNSSSGVWTLSGYVLEACGVVGLVIRKAQRDLG